MWERRVLRLRFRLKRALRQAPPRVVFLHIPKCGGTTINRHFKWNFGNGRSGMLASLDSMTGCADDETQLERARAAQFVGGHHGWTTLRKVDAGAVRFTVVREPFERLRSLYLYTRAHDYRGPHVLAKLFAASKAATFEEFCLSDDPDVRALIDNAQARTLAGDYFPFREQSPALIARKARFNLDALDFVIDQRDLNDAFPALAARTRTSLTRLRYRLNETPDRNRGLMIDRAAFLRDRLLSARIAQDLDLYEHAQALALGAPAVRRQVTLAR